MKIDFLVFLSSVFMKVYQILFDDGEIMTNATFLSFYELNGMKIAYLYRFFGNEKCNSLSVSILNRKGDNMYDCDIIEVEDFGFNHYIHHLDEYEGDGLGYKDELDFIFDLADYTSETDWE